MREQNMKLLRQLHCGLTNHDIQTYMYTYTQVLSYSIIDRKTYKCQKWSDIQCYCQICLVRCSNVRYILLLDLPESVVLLLDMMTARNKSAIVSDVTRHCQTPQCHPLSESPLSEMAMSYDIRWRGTLRLIDPSEVKKSPIPLTKIGRTGDVCGSCCLLLSRSSSLIHPANTRRWPSVGLMLGQRRRQWANISPTLDQRLLFAGQPRLVVPSIAGLMLGQRRGRWTNIKLKFDHYFVLVGVD